MQNSTGVIWSPIQMLINLPFITIYYKPSGPISQPLCQISDQLAWLGRGIRLAPFIVTCKVKWYSHRALLSRYRNKKPTIQLVWHWVRFSTHSHSSTILTQPLPHMPPNIFKTPLNYTRFPYSFCYTKPGIFGTYYHISISHFTWQFSA